MSKENQPQSVEGINIATFAEDLHGRIARNWGSGESVRDILEGTIEEIIAHQQSEVLEKVKELVASNSKGSFTDDGGNDCWYIDELLKALDSLSNNKS